MKKYSYLVAFVFFFIGCTSSPEHKPANPQATLEAKAFFQRLMTLQDKGGMYGHQDDLRYGSSWWYEAGRSDVKEAVGDYPAVVGFELGEIEIGRERSLDSVSFVQITEQVKYFHKLNGVITISWHAVNPITSQWEGRVKTANGPGSAWDVKNLPGPIKALSPDSLDAVKSILPGGENHAMFNGWLETLSNYFLTWKDDDGKLIPFLFRPYHEHSGDFFWWGRGRCTDEEYAALWKYTVDFMRKKGLHNILFVYNTDKVYSLEDFMRGYPGDEYIDMLAIDWYGSGPAFNVLVNNGIRFGSAEAQNRNKLFALSECGNISQDMVDILSKYKVSYFLTWRNRYQANPARRRPRNNEQLQTMYASPHTLFLKDIQGVK